MCGKHTTSIGSACILVNVLKKIDSVNKISLGGIQSRGSGSINHLKTEQTSCGLLFKVRGGEGIQQIWVHTNNRKQVKKEIENAKKIKKFFCCK